MSTNCTDAERLLLLRLQGSDEQALATLMRGHYSSLYNYASRFIKRDEIIKDAIQEVFISLWQRRDTAASILSLRYYLLGAVKIKALKALQKNGPHLSVDEHYDFEVEFPIEKNIIEKQLAEEKALKLKSIIAGLSARQKEMIYLKFYQQLDHGQIAGLMGISQQSVYNLLHESIQKLKKCWQAELLMKT